MHTGGERYHGLDVLRASLMALGVLLHVACSFQLGEPDGGWPYRDPQQSLLATLLVIGTHFVRMPLFFVLSGFFAAQMVERRGMRGFLADRALRVALPLAVGWVLLTPVVGFAFSYATSVQRGGDPQGALALVKPLPSGPAHLWFLYYLLLLCGLAALACLLPSAVRTRWRVACGRALGSRARGLILWILLALAMFSMSGPSLETPAGFALNASVLAAYGVCFGAGWQLRRVPGFVEGAQRGIVWRLVLGALALLLGTLAVLVWFGQKKDGGEGSGAVPFVVAQASGAAAVWLLGFGLIGACERWLGRPRPWVRHASDASYWVYLVHLPIAVFAAVLLRSWEAGALSKLAFATLATFLLSWASFVALRAVIPARQPVA